MLRLHMAKLLVKARNLGDESVADVAQRTGISRSTLHRLAAGTKAPSLATLWTLHDTYGVGLDTLVYDDPQTARPTADPRRRSASASGGRRRGSG